MLWRSGYAPVEVGGATLDAMVRATAARVPGRPALVDGASGNGVTSELVGRADRVAARLAELGLRPGDVLALWAPNAPAWVGVALGALRAGSR
jgi:acyl-CoA synthetase (AMP-forming)/AMP-acid ligase II